MLTTSPVAEDAAAYLAWLRRNRSWGTATKWTPHIRAFVAWCTLAEKTSLSDVSSFDIEAGFLEWWIDGRTLAPKTINGVVTTLRGLYRYLDRHDRLTGRNPMTRVELQRVPRRHPDPLTVDECERLLDSCTRAQQRILVAFLLSSGLRVGEACSLLQRHVSLDEGTISVHKSKSGAGVRTIPMLAEIRPEIRRWLAYLAERDQVDPSLPFLCTRTGRHVLTEQAQRSVKLAATHAGIRVAANGRSTVSPHTLRRTFGSTLLNDGVRLDAVQLLLGHESPETTARSYAALTPASVLKALEGRL